MQNQRINYPLSGPGATCEISLLHFASVAGCVETASFLLAKHANVNILSVETGGSRTPLQLAIEHSHPQLALLLLQNGADPALGFGPEYLLALLDKSDAALWAPVRLAVVASIQKQTLILRIPDLDCGSSKSEPIVLLSDKAQYTENSSEESFQKNDWELPDKFWDDVEKNDSDELTKTNDFESGSAAPISEINSQVSQLYNKDIFDILSERQFSQVNLTSIGIEKMIPLLLPGAGKVDNYTPLHLACSLGDFEAVLYILKADFTQLSCESKEFRITPVQIAAFNNHQEIVTHLLQQGASPNNNHQQNQYESIFQIENWPSALSHATAKNNKMIQSALLIAGADPVEEGGPISECLFSNFSADFNECFRSIFDASMSHIGGQDDTFSLSKFLAKFVGQVNILSKNEYYIRTHTGIQRLVSLNHSNNGLSPEMSLAATLAFRAAKENNIPMIEFIFYSMSGVFDSIDSDGWSILHRTAESASCDVLHKLLEFGVEPRLTMNDKTLIQVMPEDNPDLKRAMINIIAEYDPGFENWAARKQTMLSHPVSIDAMLFNGCNWNSTTDNVEFVESESSESSSEDEEYFEDAEMNNIEKNQDDDDESCDESFDMISVRSAETEDTSSW
ncbi:hypothetical protein HK096_006722, partial [Nowakowskiella sp. JEL0078]